MEIPKIYATKRSLYRLVRDNAGANMELPLCKYTQFSSVAQRGGHRGYFLRWDSYTAYLTLWAGLGQLRISSSGSRKDIVTNISLTELAARGMTRTA